VNDKIKQIFLHIGLPKTGSTSIQNTLYDKKNQIQLKNAGYLYPTKLELNHSFPIFSAFCDNPYEYWHNFSMGLSSFEIKANNNRNLFFLENEIKNTHQNLLILSGEIISNLTTQNLLNLRKYLESITNPKVKINIIVYVRNPLSWSVSNIQQMIKIFSTEKIAVQNTKNQIHSLFRDHIEKFIELFGEKNIHLCEFEKAVKHPYGIPGHFLSTIGFKNNTIKKFKIKNANQTISQISADIISFINLKKPMFVNGKLNTDRYSNDTQPLCKIAGQRYDIDIREKKEIFENSIKDTLWLKEKFNVDYSQRPCFQTEKKDYIFNLKICKDIEKAYSRVSPVIRQLIYQYFHEEIEESKMTKAYKQKFLNRLKQLDIDKKRMNFSLEKSLKTIRNYFVIRKSGLFDKKYYLNNDNSLKIKLNPIFHYLKHGAIQGKNPSKDFDTLSYLQKHKEVFYDGINPLVHYIIYGKGEGREIQKTFNIIDFFVLSDSIILLKMVYDYLIWHPLIYLNQKNAKILFSNKVIYNKTLNELPKYEKITTSSEKIIAGDLLLIGNHNQVTLSKLHVYNPKIKIIFLQSLSEKVDEKDLLNCNWEETLKATFKRVLFLPNIKNTKSDLRVEIMEKIFSQIFAFLEIDPWNPI